MADKISPAFEPFMADSGPNDKREALVVRRGTVPGAPVRGRLRSLKLRMDRVKAHAAAQRRVVDSDAFQNYRKLGGTRSNPKRELRVSTVGTGALPVYKVEVTRKSLNALARQENVVAVLPNQKINLIEPKAVDYESLARSEIDNGVTWGLAQLQIPQVWERTKGRGINVAVLDTGVQADHPALAGRVRRDGFMVVDPRGKRIAAEPEFDAGEHGTHVCGTIAGGQTSDGVAIGVAPEANLLVGGVLVGQSTLATLVEGIAWAVENGADIINMSLGFTYYEPLFANVFDILIEEYGILPVVAVGNENHGNTSSPGSAPNALSVGAVEKAPRNRVDVAFFSSGASLVFPGESKNELVTKPDIVAPGAQIYSSIPPEQTAHGIREYAYMDGTSMATPHVAGIAALLMSAKPSAPVSAIRDAILENAEHPGGERHRPDNRWGYGMIHPVEALQALQS